MQARLAAVVQDAHDAVIAKDLDGVITAWNDAAERIYGYPAAEAIGRHISILIPDDHRHEEETILAKIRSGARIETYETERIRADGARLDVSLTVSPITDPEAGIIGASIVARDVTAERRRRAVQAFVAGAAAFHGSLDPRETARTIVETAVPGLCELCVIDMVMPDGTIGDATVAANDMGIAEGLRALRREAPIDAEGAHPVAEVIRTGRPMVLGDLTAPGIRSRVAQSDEHARFVARHGYSSAVVVPLRARGRSLGALSFLRMGNDRRYDDHDLALFEDVGARAAVAIDNARLYHERSRIAAVLQRSLRPDRRPDIPDVDLEAIFEPAGEGIEVGGDFYDLLPVDQRWLLLIGDVAGKGPGAAALTGQIRHTVRALAVSGCSAAGLLERVNQILYEADVEMPFATAQLLELRPGDRGSIEAVLTSAGHPPAVACTSDGFRAAGGGSILGMSAEANLAPTRFELSPDTVLLLYTDGWFDAGPVRLHRSPESLAAEVCGLLDHPLAEIVGHLRRDAVNRAGGRLEDDLVLLALRRNGSDSRRR